MDIQILLFLVVGALFFIFAIMYALPLSRNLKRISSAAAAFGQGELNARANVAPRSSLAPLAEAFNGMAARLEELITSQKELTIRFPTNCGPRWSVFFSTWK